MASESTGAPAGQAEPEAIRVQLERLLGHRVFKASPRCSKLLRYLVENALADGSQPIKERVLGIEVFDREGGYDTNLDPIVRNVAADLRKRIAQYYHLPEHAGEMRIDVPAGSYLPVFHEMAVKIEEAHAAGADTPPEQGGPPPAKHSRRWVLAAGLLAVAIVAASSVWFYWSRTRLHDRFWRPFLETNDSIMLLVDGTPSTHYCGRDVARQPIDMVSVTGHFIRYFDNKGKNFDIRPVKETNLAMMRSNPLVLVALFDEPLTAAKLQPLRFHFASDCSSSAWIEDAAQPGKKDWQVDLKEFKTGQQRDYAIVARLSDASREHPLVVVSGIGETGAFTAAEFLTDPKQLDKIAKMAPGDWDAKNVELVLTTQPVDGKASSPEILAAHFW